VTATLEAVQQLVRETLAQPDDFEVRPEHLLFYELAFTSMDLLDLLFRIEDRFGIAVPEGTLRRHVQGDVPDDEFARDGVLTPQGRARLMAALHDSPPSIFPASIHTSTLPRYCTVAAIVRLIDAGQSGRG
jgi:acyl carrier protein